MGACVLNFRKALAQFGKENTPFGKNLRVTRHALNYVYY